MGKIVAKLEYSGISFEGSGQDIAETIKKPDLFQRTPEQPRVFEKVQHKKNYFGDLQIDEERLGQ